MDLLDFEGQDLYFEGPLVKEAKDLLDQAADAYEDNEAETPLMRAFFLAPDHPMVQVALYRFFYYQHRYEDALLVADRVLAQFSSRLGIPAQWQAISMELLDGIETEKMPMVRFYLLALKGAAYLELRLGRISDALLRLETLIAVDEKDRLGGQGLMDVARESLDEQPEAASG
ncbi:MAG: hypothetical protein ACWA44_10905 [Thiotrichales bacterium]